MGCYTQSFDDIIIPITLVILHVGGVWGCGGVLPQKVHTRFGSDLVMNHRM